MECSWEVTDSQASCGPTSTQSLPAHCTRDASSRRPSQLELQGTADPNLRGVGTTRLSIRDVMGERLFSNLLRVPRGSGKCAMDNSAMPPEAGPRRHLDPPAERTRTFLAARGEVSESRSKRHERSVREPSLP